jgi:hypothetical protein
VPAEASYSAAQPVAEAADAQRWALDLEEDCAGAYRYLLVAPVLAVTGGTGPGASGGRPSGSGSSGSDGPALSATEQAGLRRQALTGLTTAASDATRWRSLLSPTTPTTAFPGI